MPNPESGDNPVLRIKGKSLLPIVQGGMGVGISAHRLAGHVARAGAVGTLSSVDLRRHHPDLMAQTAKSRDKELINRVNLLALDREVRAALEIAGGNGLIAVNVMRAVLNTPPACARPANPAPRRSWSARACRSICRI